jgi:hypothetical protein
MTVIIHLALWLLPLQRRERYRTEWFGLYHYMRARRIPFFKQLAIVLGLIQAAVRISCYTARTRWASIAQKPKTISRSGLGKRIMLAMLTLAFIIILLPWDDTEVGPKVIVIVSDFPVITESGPIFSAHVESTDLELGNWFQGSSPTGSLTRTVGSLDSDVGIKAEITLLSNGDIFLRLSTAKKTCVGIIKGPIEQADSIRFEGGVGASGCEGTFSDIDVDSNMLRLTLDNVLIGNDKFELLIMKFGSQ